MIKRATALGRDRPFRSAGFPFGRIAVLLGSALAVSVALTGCGSGKQADAPAAGDKTASSSAPGSSSPGPATGSAEAPCRQWWVGRSGFGWSAKLDCLPGTADVPAQCAVLAEVGSHAGSAELVVLRSGALVSSPQTTVSFDGGRPMAADLDHDGWLDVLGTENDYQPNYASGRNYWATYRLVDGSLQRTGCLPRRTTAEAPPERLLTGECPVRFPS